MAENVSEFILRRPHEEWDVERIYGYPGDGKSGLLGAFHEHGDKIRFVQSRHELAAFMACAHAKMTAEVGVCMATSGLGAIHLLNGLYDAKLDRQWRGGRGVRRRPARRRRPIVSPGRGGRLCS